MSFSTSDERSSYQLDQLPCPLCCGEGSLLLYDGAGRFDERQECWMPQEEWEPCAACRGHGLIYASRHFPTEPANERVAPVEDELPF